MYTMCEAILQCIKGQSWKMYEEFITQNMYPIFKMVQKSSKFLDNVKFKSNNFF